MKNRNRVKLKKNNTPDTIVQRERLSMMLPLKGRISVFLSAGVQYWVI